MKKDIHAAIVVFLASCLRALFGDRARGGARNDPNRIGR
jgi:hypothetical protein